MGTFIITFTISAVVSWAASGIIGMVIVRKTWYKYYDAESHKDRHYATLIMMLSGPFTIRHSIDVNKMARMHESQGMQRANYARENGVRVTYRIWNAIKGEHLDMFHQHLELNTPEVARMYLNKAYHTHKFHKNELRIHEYIEGELNRPLDKK